MHRSLLLFAICLSVTPICGCRRELTSEERAKRFNPDFHREFALDDFDTIHNRSQAHIIWEPGNRPYAILDASRLCLETTTCEVKKGVLELKSHAGYRTNGSYIIRVCSPKLVKVDILEGTLDATGIDADHFDLSFGGGKYLHLKGKARSAKLSTAIQGVDIDISNFVVGDLILDARGRGELTVNAQSVDASLMNAHVVCIGNPTITRRSMWYGATIEPAK